MTLGAVAENVHYPFFLLNSIYNVIWCQAGGSDLETASWVNKTGLVLASVESKRDPEKDTYFNPGSWEALWTLDPFVRSPLCWVLSVAFHSLHCPSEHRFFIDPCFSMPALFQALGWATPLLFKLLPGIPAALDNLQSSFKAYLKGHLKQTCFQCPGWSESFPPGGRPCW